MSLLDLDAAARADPDADAELAIVPFIPSVTTDDRPSALEKLQRTNETAEIWWDSPPLDFPAWRDRLLDTAPDADTRRRWSAQLDRFMDLGDPGRSLVRGVTTNPSLISKSVLADPVTWGREVRRHAVQQQQFDPEAVYELLYRESVERSAHAMLSMWEHTDGRHGWVSAQLDPRCMFDRERMLEQALDLVAIGPNVMVKVPGTVEGYTVIRDLVSRGISINNTLTYTVPQFLECVRAVEEGLATARAAGVDLHHWRAVVTHMIGRFGTQGDLIDEAEQRGIELDAEDVRWAEVAVLKEIDAIIRANDHPVKMLLSSLEVEAPDQSDTVSMHLQHTAGADVVYTCKPDFVAGLMHRDGDSCEFEPDAIDGPVPDDVLARLERLPYFRQAISGDGIAPERFAGHGAFVSTFAEVNRNTRKLIDFISRQIENLPATTTGEAPE